jgi:hypothetical protein
MIRAVIALARVAERYVQFEGRPASAESPSQIARLRPTPPTLNLSRAATITSRPLRTASPSTSTRTGLQSEFRGPRRAAISRFWRSIAIAMAELDGNRDGVMNARDGAWRDLLLWYDQNHDGRSSAAELVAIASSNITAIGTGHRWSGRRDPFGNLFRYAGEITFEHGRRDAYDVYFLAAN